MSADDIIKRAERFLNQCGSCDAGLPMGCTCPRDDYRPVMLELVREVERLRASYAEIPPLGEVARRAYAQGASDQRALTGMGY